MKNKNDVKQINNHPFEYKGFHCMVDYRYEINKLCGQVCENDIVVYGDSIEELENEFKNAIDKYISNKLDFECSAVISEEQTIEDNRNSLSESIDEINERIRFFFKSLEKIFFHREVGCFINSQKKGDCYEGELQHASDSNIKCAITGGSISDVYDTFITCVDDLYDISKSKCVRPKVIYDGSLSVKIEPKLHYILQNYAMFMGEKPEDYFEYFVKRGFLYELSDLAETDKEKLEGFLKGIGVNKS